MTKKELKPTIKINIKRRKMITKRTKPKWAVFLVRCQLPTNPERMTS